MTAPFIDDVDLKLYLGDALDIARQLPSSSVDCIATSPPYWGLRDYGMPNQIGLEPTPWQYVLNLVKIFDQLRRVLRPQGTLWLNLGDTYAGNRSYQVSDSKHPTHDYGEANSAGVPEGLKPKDLVGVPWRVAFALQEDGWYLRSDVIWAKPNPMPSSVKDRPTTSHEYLFLLSKNARYYYDAEAIAEPAEWARWGDQTVPKYQGTETATGWIQPKTKQELVKRRTVRKDIDGKGGGQGDGESTGGLTRNARSVWSIPTQPYARAHFATWPEKLAERIIRAGCPEGGTILDPFAGSGTTLFVARKLGRKSIGIELSPEYAQMTAERTKQLSLLA